MLENIFSNLCNGVKNLPWETISFSDWIQIGIALISFIVTVVLTIVIFKIQSRHERQIDKIENSRRQAELENKADQFLITNEAERDYLPWCVLASNLHRHNHHTREIYTNFCRCSDELQNEILRKANFSFCTIPDKNWTKDAFESLKIDIENHQLGRNILNENEEDFFNGYRCYRSKPWEDLDFAEMFDPIVPNLRMSSFFEKDGKISLSDYIVDYFHYRYSEYEPPLYNERPIPPIDYLYHCVNFGNADGITASAWTIQVVKRFQ